MSGLSARGFVAFPDAAALLSQLDGRSGVDRREDDRRVTLRAGAAAFQNDRLGVRELCHDLRQPVSAILVLTEVIAQEPGMTPVSRRRLTALQGEAQLLRDFVEHFLSCSPEARPLDLGELATNVVELAATTAACHLEVRVRGEATVTADRVMLHRALLNLVDNACRAAGRGTVRVSVDVEDGSAVVSVEDSGPEQGQVMTRGPGLGLYIATTVVHACGGTLASSDGELGGLRVVLVLPRSASQEEPGPVGL
ncbi:MAG: histidine kinase [Frankiales bacterium]|nr:histidine kinase [Frankiales bacterium]